MRATDDAFYALTGLLICLAGTVIALVRARGRRSFYAAQVYHMTARSHRRFAVASAAFALGFGAALRWPVVTIPLLALYTLLLILYLSSFARGFSDDDE